MKRPYLDQLGGEAFIWDYVIVDSHELASEVLIPPCFALLHCGDWSMFDRSAKAMDTFDTWLGEQPAEFKLITCGNDEYPVETAPKDGASD